MVVDTRGGAKVGTLLGRLLLTAFAQLAGSEDGDGLGLAHAFILHELVDGHLA